MTIRHPRRTFAAVVLSALCLAMPLAYAEDEAPDALVARLSSDVLQTIKSDAAVADGDIAQIMAIVDSKIMPNVDFIRMTASATGPSWRQATPEQRQRLQAEFKALLIRTYAGALGQVSDKKIDVLPMRGSATDDEVVVKTLVKGRADPIQLDYRLGKTPGQGYGWKMYDLNVLGVWLVDNYRPQFAQQIRAGGIDGLIKSLAERNQANGGS